MTASELVQAARDCRVCADYLPLGPRPVFQVHPEARLLIVGQAPGLRVHETGIPWDDASGDRLRTWLGLDERTFRDPTRVALMPMGFCYPGRGPSGDLPPRRECAPLWQAPLRALMTEVRLTLLIGTFAVAWYLGSRAKASLTETVQAWRDYLPDTLPLVHPSPRNAIWRSKNPWFEKELVPQAAERVALALG